MNQIMVYQGIFNKLFHSDFLVSAERKDAKNKRKRWNEALSVSIIGYASDLKNYLRPNRKIVISHQKDKYSEAQSFTINNLKDYDVKTIKSGDFLKAIITKRVDSIIKQEAEDDENKSQPSYPLLFLTDKNQEEQKTRVYSMVKNGVTTPMFPNVDEHLILAGQLFIDKADAKELLKYFKGKSTKKFSKKVIKRAEFLIKSFNEWKEYIFTEMKSNDLVRPVKVNYSPNNVEAFEIVIDEQKIESIVQNGIRNGEIRFTNRTRYTEHLDDFNEYMTAFAPAMSRRIDSLAKPHHRNGDIRPETDFWLERMLRQPITAQRDGIEACLKSLETKNKVNLVGECGVGKTLMMLGSNWAYNKKQNQAMKLLVYCPDHIVYSTWVNETKVTLPNVETHVIKSIADLLKFEKSGLLSDDTDRVFVVGQHVAKAGYTNKPSVSWSVSRQAFTCPDCGHEFMQKIKNESHDPTAPKYIDVPVKFDYFSSETIHNRRCKNKECNSIFWEPYNKFSNKKSQFIYVTDTKTKSGVSGFFPKDIRPVKKTLQELVKLFNAATSKKEKAKLQKKIEQYRNIEMMIEGKKEEDKKISPYKVSVAEYIYKKMKYRFTNLIIDEFHEFQGDSSRADACSQLINSIKVVQTGTGTAMNGYAKSRFKTDYMLYPEKMKEHGFDVNDDAKYQVAFGVTEKRYKLVNKNGKNKRSALAPREKPGISPVIFPLFMQDTTVFIALADLKDNLPKLHHYQIEVDMDPALEEKKKEFEKEIKKVARYDKKLFRTSIQVGYSFLDSPTVEKEIRDPHTKDILLKTPTVPAHNDNKMKALIDFVKQEVEVDRKRVMIYTCYTGSGINNHLRDNLEKEGYKVTILNKQIENSILNDGTTKKVKKENREEVIKDEVKNGTEVLIVNPELVKTGMNLTEFPTICYYQMGYQVYTNRQADRRAWRIGQEHDCKIVYIYYKDSIQQDIASLMATKIVASQAIEGNMDAAGLEAILNERTAEEELASKFYEGIRGKVSLSDYNDEDDDDLENLI